VDRVTEPRETDAEVGILGDVPGVPPDEIPQGGGLEVV
jgi:hypothetical protein